MSLEVINGMIRFVNRINSIINEINIIARGEFDLNYKITQIKSNTSSIQISLFQIYPNLYNSLMHIRKKVRGENVSLAGLGLNY